MLSIVVAIVGLAVLIIVHEGGHFLVARLCGMRVERFSLGFGRPLLAFKRGETTYQIAPIPLGGFVQITGLNPHEEFDRTDPMVYPNRPRWMRLAVLVAGPAANYLTACLLAVIVFTAYGRITNTNTIESVFPGAPAAAAGLRAGDALLEVNGQALSAKNPITAVVRASRGAPLALKVHRSGQVMTVNVVARKDPESGSYLIGIRPGLTREPVPVAIAVREALVLPAVESANILNGIFQMITGRQQASLTGPVGITRVLAKTADQGVLEFVQLLMMLSIYLGLFNLLPLPALDGGRALFLGIGALRRTDVNAKTEANVHMVGLVVLMGVFVVVTFKDIKDLFVRAVSN